MKTLISIILIFVFVFVFVFPGCGVSKNQTALSKDNDLVKLSLEFIRLRNIHGHFQGGSWNDEVDSWMGPKHRVMIALSSQLGRAHYTASDLQRFMGEPDLIIKQTDPRFDQMNQWAFEEKSTASPPDMYFVYEWRGDHDFLIFACQKDIVLFSKWRYVGE